MRGNGSATSGSGKSPTCGFDPLAQVPETGRASLLDRPGSDGERLVVLGRVLDRAAVVRVHEILGRRSWIEKDFLLPDVAHDELSTVSRGVQLMRPVAFVKRAPRRVHRPDASRLQLLLL